MLNNIVKNYFSVYSNLPKACWQSVFLTFIESLATGIVFFLSIYFVGILKFSIDKAGFLIASYGIGTICGSIFAGKLSDLLSPKKISAINLLFQSFAFISLAKLNRFDLLILNMFSIGICTYAFMTANNLWLMKQSASQAELRLKCISMTRVASNLGMAGSGIVIGIFHLSQFYILFYLSSIALLFSAIFCYFFVTENKQIGNIDKKFENEKNLQFKNIISIKIIVLMFAFLFIVGLFISQLSVTYPIYIQESFPHLGTQGISLLFVLDTLVIVFVQVPLINLIKNHNKIFLVGLGIFMMSLGMFILNYLFSFSLAILSCLIWTIGEIIFLGIAQFICYESANNQKKGQIMGLFQAISAFGRVVGPIIGGYIYYTLSGNFLWSLIFIVGILCFSVSLYFKKYDFIKN